MSSSPLASVAAALLAFSSIQSASAASLRVAPVNVQLVAPAATTTVTISNDEDHPIYVQVRLFRWQIKDGKESYTPAEGVVASPPMTKLKAGGENVVRIVRTSKAAIRSEESYRLIVDELPDASRANGGTVALVVRHAIPVFFSKQNAGDAEVTWTAEAISGGYRVIARNAGERRLRVADLELLAGKKTIASQKGLIGYVLAGSTATWNIPAAKKGASTRGSVSVEAMSETGPIRATATIR